MPDYSVNEILAMVRGFIDVMGFGTILVAIIVIGVAVSLTSQLLNRNK